MLENPTISVALMCYNEVSTLESVTVKTRDILSLLNCDHEIIIVDDGSTDGSGELADRLAEKNQSIRVIHHEYNMGIGKVLQTAYMAAEKDWISIIPTDGEFDPADLVIGYKKLEDGILVAYAINKLPPLKRRFVSAIQKSMNFLLFGLSVSRINWVKIIPVKATRECDFISDSPVIETEVLVRLSRNGYRIVELPSNNELHLERKGGMNTQIYLGAILKSFKDSFRLWWNLLNHP
jgi:glycosyltransferase involved in cell wall biosynthesis